MRELAASAPFYEALLGFLGDTRVKREAALHVRDLVREGTILGGAALRAAHSARPHDRTSAGLHRLAVHAAVPLDRGTPMKEALMTKKGAALLDASADDPQDGAGAAAVFGTDPDGLKLEVVPLPG